MQFIKDSIKDKKLNALGYCVVDNIGDIKTKQLAALFSSLTSNRDNIPYDKLFTCLTVKDNDFKQDMHQGIRDILDDELNKHLINYSRASYTFQVKGIGNQSELRPHLDWSFTNEFNGSSTYTLWIPLVPSTIKNGTLFVLPSSHHYFKSFRGSGIQQSIDGLHDYIPQYLKPIDVNPGDLLIFNTRLLHYSPNNLSDKIRVSVMANLVDNNSEFHLYYPNKKKKCIDEYVVPNEFFLLYDDMLEERKIPPTFGVKQNAYKEKSEMLTKLQFNIINFKSKVRTFVFNAFNL
jgi:ectoine hydroxylase-related dioxygenase (phytanoyl-CoA dioxygenase family)